MDVFVFIYWVNVSYAYRFVWCR